jgi:hypothetical protein
LDELCQIITRRQALEVGHQSAEGFPVLWIGQPQGQIAKSV